MNATLRVMNLTKKFGSLTAVDNISFSATQGEIVGLLGPNGAGKSSTMKMIAGFLTPTAGTAYICGYDILEQPVHAKRLLGYLPEGAPNYPDMRVKDFLSFIGQIRRAPTDLVTRELNLAPVLNQRIENLSKGYKRRLGLAQALMHNPQVLILDEPTDGLDPNQKREIRDLLISIAHDKVIIISTHVLQEVELLCNRVLVLAAGKLILDSTPEDLAGTSGMEEEFIRITQGVQHA